MRWPWKLVIDRDNVPYLTRWMLFPKNQTFNVYLHRFTAPDWALDLHDHPFSSVGIVLAGSYMEEYNEWMPAPGSTNSFRDQKPGNIQYRNQRCAHRVACLRDNKPVWTLFFRGPTRKGWGFWTEDGRRFVDSGPYIEAHYNKDSA